ncbi:MAG: NAD(P)H-hydrate dehydratase [Spirochaetaceae bacterium]|jgi:hydroxyethylthiazole kinase-like uncharacterized protein yjeF|nr:NAD(P)H-hydrate dehydratase [Spirochaetaceae bacterium]
MEVLSETILKEVIIKRPQQSHKGTFGRTALIGGNPRFGGAILMAAQACVYAGAGLTTVITHEKNHAPLHARLPEAMVIDWQDMDMAAKIVQSSDAVLIGCGLGTEPESLRLLRFLLNTLSEKHILVVDGSAITLMAEPPLPIPFPRRTIFTPHEMEWQRLSGLKIEEQGIEKSAEKARQIGSIIVQKSHRTTIFTPQGHAFVLPLGTPAMATGGMGDTLAGIVTAFAAQFKEDLVKSVCAAAYLHSYIAEKLAETRYVVLPTQIAEKIPETMKRFERYEPVRTAD